MNKVITDLSFNKKYLTIQQIQFFENLIKFIRKFDEKIKCFAEYRNVNKKFIKELEFFNFFYKFLKRNEKIIEISKLTISGKKVNTLSRVQNNFISKKFRYALNTPRISILIAKNENYIKKFDKQILTEYHQFYTIDLNIADIFESCMRLLIFLSYFRSRCRLKKVNDILFDIHFEIYQHMVPHHFEDLGQNSWGLLSQIQCLKTHLL